MSCLNRFMLWMTAVAMPLPGAVSFRAQLGEVIDFLACVYDDVGYPLQNQPVYWIVSAAAFSGFHSHNQPIRSPGFLSPASGSITGADGCARGTYFATDVAGVHWIEAWAYTAVGFVYDYMEVQVRVFPDLLELPNYYPYQKVGVQPEHPLSHYGTFGALFTLQRICEEFFQRTGMIAGINDMSLPWGGRFDLGPRYGGQWWSAPHSSHMYGRNADIPYRFLGPYRDLFEQIAIKHRAALYFESDHFHLTLPD